METKKAVTIPISKIINSALVNAKPNLNSFKKLAPNITGIPRKNVNSAAISLETPKRIPPIIVEPEREVPGTKDNT